jgi:very-short-patch-repair endonuclease
LAEIKEFIESLGFQVNKGKNRKLLDGKEIDLIVEDTNICIEYDGEQHFMHVSIYGGEEKFKQQQINDRIKNKYCEKNGIELLRISYKISGYQKISEEIKKYLGV